MATIHDKSIVSGNSTHTKTLSQHHDHPDNERDQHERLHFSVIELHMMETRKFFPLAIVGSALANLAIHPLYVLRTRLQIEQKAAVTPGNTRTHTHATANTILRRLSTHSRLIASAREIMVEEGTRGFYKGFLVKCAQIPIGVGYVATYELLRQRLLQESAISSTPHGLFANPAVCSFVAGGVASCVNQFFQIPFEIITQHMIISSSSSPVSQTVTSSASSYRVQSSLRLDAATFRANPGLERDLQMGGLPRIRAIIKQIYSQHGGIIGGFYRGYTVQCMVTLPSSAIWWAAYTSYCDLLHSFQSRIRRLFNSTYEEKERRNFRLPTQLLSATLAGLTSSLIVNPLDVVRVNIQLNPFHLAKPSLLNVAAQLWAAERHRFLVKGLSARLLSSSIYSFFVILAYEPFKLASLKPEFRHVI